MSTVTEYFLTGICHMLTVGRWECIPQYITYGNREIPQYVFFCSLLYGQDAHECWFLCFTVHQATRARKRMHLLSHLMETRSKM